MPDPASPDVAESSATISLKKAVGKAAGWLASDALTNGDRAELRRIDPASPITPALWKVLLRLEEEGASVGLGHDAQERRWATLLMAMSLCISPSQNLHDYDVPLGQGLAAAGWSETRFVRLLEADAETLPVLIRRMAQYLASKQQAVDWSDVAWLLFTVSDDANEDVRLNIARSYYRTLYAQEQEE
jgi:CRISPR system Cascade subunit CasB